MITWINIQDRLPDEEVGVLVVTKTGQITVAERVRYGLLDGDWTWGTHLVNTNDECWLDFGDEDVTHWAVLPEAPK